MLNQIIELIIKHFICIDNFLLFVLDFFNSVRKYFGDVKLVVDLILMLNELIFIDRYLV